MRPSLRILCSATALGLLCGACSEHRLPTGPVATARDAGAASDRVPAGFSAVFFPGATQTFPLDINDHGVIVGRYSSGGRTHGFLRDESGAYTTIDYPGSTFSVAGSVNDSGVIAGWFTAPASTARHGFILKDGTFTSFDPPGSRFTNALGINERGDVSGRYCTLSVCQLPGGGTFHGFLMHDGVVTTVDVPGADETNAFKLEPSGVVVGGFGDVGGEEDLFTYSKGEFATFALPNGKSISQDNGGVNAHGDIVGLYCNSAIPCLITPTGTHGFLLSRGELTTIDYPGAVATSATGINARGDIVGGYFDGAAVLRGFLLSRHGLAP